MERKKKFNCFRKQTQYYNYSQTNPENSSAKNKQKVLTKLVLRTLDPNHQDFKMDLLCKIHIFVLGFESQLFLEIALKNTQLSFGSKLMSGLK